jgi:hypothetical protein
MKTTRLVHDVNWELGYIMRTLDKIACGNIAPIPIAIALEEGKWSIDIQVHVPRVTEYEVAVWDHDLATALAKASQSLTHYKQIQDNAERNNALYGIKV